MNENELAATEYAKHVAGLLYLFHQAGMTANEMLDLFDARLVKHGVYIAGELPAQEKPAE